MKKIILQLVFLILLLSPSLAYDDDDDDDEGTNSNKHKKWWSTPLIVVLYMGFFLIAAMVSLCIRHFRDRANIRNHHRREADRGLDEEEIESLPSLRYSEMKLKGIEPEPSLECAICLAEFKDQEVVRVLPDCYHVFHPPCIAPWLASHVTCPICRSSLEHKQGSSASMSSILDGTSGHVSQRFDHSGSQHDHDHDHDHVTIEIENEGSSEVLHSEEYNNNLDDHGPRVTSGSGKLLPRPYSTGDLTLPNMVENCSTSLSSLIMPKESSPKSDYRTTNVNKEVNYYWSCISAKSDRFVDYSSLVLAQLNSTIIESANHETSSSGLR